MKECFQAKSKLPHCPSYTLEHFLKFEKFCENATSLWFFPSKNLQGLMLMIISGLGCVFFFFCKRVLLQKEGNLGMTVNAFDLPGALRHRDNGF